MNSVHFVNTKRSKLLAVACVTKKHLQIQFLQFMIDQELEYKALKLLEQQPDLTQRQLSEALGVSLGKTHYLIKSLIDVGWLKLENFKKSHNKWGYLYLLTPKGILEKSLITTRFLKSKQKEYNRLRNEIELLKQEVKNQSLNQ